MNIIDFLEKEKGKELSYFDNFGRVSIYEQETEKTLMEKDIHEIVKDLMKHYKIQDDN